MRVLITQAIDPAGTAILTDAGLALDSRDDPHPIGSDELRARTAGCAALLPMPTDPVDADVLSTPGLRVVACHSVGTDHVDLDAARAHGVVVTHTPGVLTDATADLAMALILATARRLGEGERLLRRGAFHGWRPTMLRGLDLHDATLGIVGMGRIGTAVADRARAFGMHIRGTTSASSRDDLLELLATSDVVSLHCPLTDDTVHLLDSPTLARMKPGAILVNTARGAVIDEDALADALEAGHLAGAGLDVHAAEPRVHPRLLPREDVVLLPHLGSATWQTRRAMATKAATNLVAVLQGRTPPDRVV
ncbi:MAG: D-glycerate dehydrogenase [Alphaproteobacteria bacterium]|nr:D-glycerate dehydrogenase [Alphaproteobacteria bacterium]